MNKANEVKHSRRQGEPEKEAHESHRVVVAGLVMDKNCRTAVVADKALERVTVIEGTTTIR